MNSNLFFQKLLAGVFVFSLFLLLTTVIFAGMSALLSMLGDSAAAFVLGWISAGMGFLFFSAFLLLVFLFIGFSLLGNGLTLETVDEEMTCEGREEEKKRQTEKD